VIFMKSLECINLSYENHLNTKVSEYRFKCDPIARLSREIRGIRSLIEQGETQNNEIRFQLWKILQLTLSWLDDFSSLREKVDEATSICYPLMRRIPAVSNSVANLNGILEEIFSLPSNPKLKFLEQLDEDIPMDGLFAKLSSLRIPLWSGDGPLDRVSFGDRSLRVVRLRESLSENFKGLVVPAGVSKKDLTGLLGVILNSGITERFLILLYDFESFRLPPRQRLKNSVFPKLTSIEGERQTVELEDEILSEQEWADEYFWLNLHGGLRNRGSADHKGARYFLFQNGSGTFLPDSYRIFRLLANEETVSAEAIFQVQARDVRVGDWIIIREGQSEELLDHFEAQGKGEGEDSEFLPDWVNWLESVSLLKPASEISQDLASRGVTVRSSTVSAWISLRTRGPADENVFKGLLRYLIESRPTSILGVQSIDSYIQQEWHELVTWRNNRQRAGTKIREELFSELKATLGKRVLEPESDNSIHLGSTEVSLLILKVDSIDTKMSFVSQARIAQIDEHRGSRWLR
jgi:hypothetical protein